MVRIRGAKKCRVQRGADHFWLIRAYSGCMKHKEKKGNQVFLKGTYHLITNHADAPTMKKGCARGRGGGKNPEFLRRPFVGKLQRWGGFDT